MSIDGSTHTLAPPFIVLATQNPIEQEGTYELPAAQLDRFLVRILVDYPDMDDEKQIVRRTTAGSQSDLEPVLSRDEILALQKLVQESSTPHDIPKYATALARATRPGPEAPEGLGELIAWGVGPRAAQALVMAAKARALMDGRTKPTCADVRVVLPAVMGHRVIPSFTAAAREITADEIVRRVRDAVPSPDGWKPEPQEVEEGFLAGLMRRLRREPAPAGTGG